LAEVEKKQGTSRRGFVKYVVGLVAALAAAVVGYGVFTRKREETPEILPPSQTIKQEGPETGLEWFQVGNTQSIIQLQPKQSNELEDNRIGGMAGGLTGGGWLPGEPWDGDGIDGMVNQVVSRGLKRFRVSISNLDADNVDWNVPELSIDPSHDALITLLTDNDVAITYVLTFWDMATWPEGEGANCPRFKDEDEIQRYLDFVQFIVHHFKDRIQYFEIWNEPNTIFCPQSIEVADYIDLVKRAVPVIRQENPEAKIVVGGTGGGGWYDYLFSILRSDIMPLVDVVSWHPMYGTSPEFDSEYYYEYPAIVQEIKDVASAHGFEGDYEADELTWFTIEGTMWDGWSHRYSDTVAAKYQARGTVMHLGMDVTAGIASALIFDTTWVAIPSVIRNLCTIMAGAEPINLTIEIQSEATNIKSYGFSLSNGDKLIALWTDGIAVDDDPGVEANLTVQGITSEDVTGIDVLNGYQQSIIASSENENLAIQNLIVRDCPVILRITKSID
jgi:hypothetical protein